MSPVGRDVALGALMLTLCVVITVAIWSPIWGPAIAEAFR